MIGQSYSVHEVRSRVSNNKDWLVERSETVTFPLCWDQGPGARNGAMLPWNHGSPGGMDHGWCCLSCNPNRILCYALLCYAMLGLCVTTIARCLLRVSFSLCLSFWSGKYSCIVHSNRVLTIYYGHDRSLSTIREGFQCYSWKVDHQTSRTDTSHPPLDRK